ncbi:glycosyltransferase, partial [Candidatus Kaiserbacteria bacterium CG_4_9_14_0_2_um_filter_41_32]
IFVLGNITEAARFLKAFNMFVLASKSESYGYVLHEAGLAELPVVATN